jgi:hypothetical protein
MEVMEVLVLVLKAIAVEAILQDIATIMPMEVPAALEGITDRGQALDRLSG